MMPLPALIHCTSPAAMIETVPLDQAAAAYAKMMAGKARFRIVLVTNNGV